MTSYRARSTFLAAAFVIGVTGAALAQDGRVFLKTPETIAIWEFNDLDVGFLEALPNGTVIPDLSGNGLDATVEANESGSLVVGDADLNFDPNTSVAKVGGTGQARVAINNDRDSFEFGPDDDFSIELYVYRDEQPGTQNWGILAGTWHSRTLLDDTKDPIADGAWYGYGFIRHNEGGGWAWNCSPINADGTFTPSWNEQASSRFEIPEGSHYVVATGDRELDQISVYLDGEFTGSVNIPDGSALITPTDYEHARFLFFTGQDDGTRNSFRQAPTGYAIDAARIQSRALEPDEVLDNWLNIQDGLAIPVDQPPEPIAVVTASSRELLVNQCVLLSAANSTGGEGQDIAKYDWKIGDGPFEEGEATREMSFDAPSGDAGIQVTVRVTNTADATAEASVTLQVAHPAPVAEIVARRGGEVVSGAVVLGTGETLHLDGTSSTTPIPAGAVICPISDGIAVEAPGIAQFLWDLDSDGTVDNTEPSAETPPFTTPGDVTITLTVANDAGGESSTTLGVTVIDRPNVQPAPPGRIFLPTPETVGIWEFNELDFDIEEPLPSGTVIPDLSGNGLDATVEENDGGALVVGEGDLNFDDNTTVSKVAGSAATRVVINDDGDAFEMDELQDFSIELYVRRAEEPGGQNWGILAGTWHSRTLLDDGGDPIADGAWYGYGLIRNNDSAGWLWTFSPINADGTFNPSWNELGTPAFDIPAGSHYVVVSVDRHEDAAPADTATVYVDGAQVGQRTLPKGQALITPTDYEHARFMFFTGEDDSTRGAYRQAPSGYAIDAARVMYKALSSEEVLENHQLIQLGIAVPPSEVTATPFHRGDPNDDGTINITDAVGILNFLFGAGATPQCAETADVNNDGAINITDPVGLLNFLFGGGAAPPAPPGPTTEPCGVDPDDPGSPGDLGCDSYVSC